MLCFDLSQAQAIGRVHRIGQTQKTTAHHFVVKDTVEESLLRALHSQNTSTIDLATATVTDLVRLKDASSVEES